MKPTIIVTERPLDWMIEHLAEHFEVHVLDKGQPLATLAPAAREARGIARFAGGRVDRALIEALPRLEVVANFGAGYELVDLDAARERAIAISNNTSGSPAAMADHAVALLLAATRRLVDTHRFIADGRWLTERYPLTEGLTGSKVGIYGLGRIGKAVALRLAPFEVSVGYHNRRPAQGLDLPYFPSLAGLAAWADHLVISCPSTHETRGSVDAAVLAALGPRGVVVNIARGNIIDQPALIAALDAGRIGGAGLDVLLSEPDRPMGLIDRPNVVLTPHVAGSTREGWLAATDRMRANLLAFFATGAVLTPVPDQERRA
jgi:lactate dehydrogenase-like 2-hydroxyacid dehydrogenase